MFYPRSMWVVEVVCSLGSESEFRPRQVHHSRASHSPRACKPTASSGQLAVQPPGVQHHHRHLQDDLGLRCPKGAFMLSYTAFLLQCSALLCGPPQVDASQSMQQMWTTLQHNGPNHLGFPPVPRSGAVEMIGSGDPGYDGPGGGWWTSNTLRWNNTSHTVDERPSSRVLVQRRLDTSVARLSRGFGLQVPRHPTERPSAPTASRPGRVAVGLSVKLNDRPRWFESEFPIPEADNCFYSVFQ